MSAVLGAVVLGGLYWLFERDLVIALVGALVFGVVFFGAMTLRARRHRGQ